MHPRIIKNNFWRHRRLAGGHERCCTFHYLSWTDSIKPGLQFSLFILVWLLSRDRLFTRMVRSPLFESRCKFHARNLYTWYIVDRFTQVSVRAWIVLVASRRAFIHCKSWKVDIIPIFSRFDLKLKIRWNVCFTYIQTVHYKVRS